MVDVEINIFKGVGSQIPVLYTLQDINIYQDIITSFINSGKNSGRLYDLNGAEVSYLDPVKITVLNYVALEPEITESIITANEEVLPFNLEMTYRDLYNYSVAQGISLNSKLYVNGEQVDLEDQVIQLEGPELEIKELDVTVYVSHQGDSEVEQSIILKNMVIYQDICTSLINQGYQSGQIYTLNGKEVDYLSHIIDESVHYIISIEEPLTTIVVRIMGSSHRERELPITANMKYRDLYNYAVAKGEPIDSFFVVRNRKVKLENIIPNLGVTIFLFYDLP